MASYCKHPNHPTLQKHIYAFAAQCGQTNMFEIILDIEENKNPKNGAGETPFLVACRKGRMNIVSLILKKSDELKIDLNAKNKGDQTAFHLACSNGHSEIAEMIIKNSPEMKIDLGIKQNNGWTVFHTACYAGHSKVAEMIMKNSSNLKKYLQYQIYLLPKQLQHHFLIEQ